VFGDLPKLFGREFAIAFLLPVAVFIPASLLVASSFVIFHTSQTLQNINVFVHHEALLGATLFVFLLWLGAVTLLALNRAIIRTKEGYGKLNPARLLLSRQRRRFRRRQSELQELSDRARTLKVLGQELDSASERRRYQLALSLSTEFPHAEAFVLPTAFGNTIRAFEVYSSAMYGLDAIPGWPRLLMVMPTSSRSLVDTAKAEMDFWLNLWLLSVVLFLEYVLLVIGVHQRGNPWALIALPLCLISSYRARAAAAGWGELVKAAFDVHLPDLRNKLELCHENAEKEKVQWQQLSAALIYRAPGSLPPKCVDPRADSVTTRPALLPSDDSEKKDEDAEEDRCQSESNGAS